MNRRRLITGLFFAPAAPVIIRASSLMAVRSLPYSIREAANLLAAPGKPIILSFTKGMKEGELYRATQWLPIRSGVGWRVGSHPVGPALARGTHWNNFRLTTAGMAMVP